MVEIRIHGRGGQGGVTLAKLIASTRFLEGDSVQAFGLYAAERSGAPIQAFCRYSSEPITNRNLIYEPDHVVVLDPTLIGPGIMDGLKPGGWILLNSPEALDRIAADYPSYRLASVDATAIDDVDYSKAQSRFQKPSNRGAKRRQNADFQVKEPKKHGKGGGGGNQFRKQHKGRRSGGGRK